MRLDQTNLAVLIEDTERVSLCLENDTNSLQAIIYGQTDEPMFSEYYLLELYQVMKLVVSNDVRAVSDLGGFSQVFGEHRHLLYVLAVSST